MLLQLVLLLTSSLSLDWVSVNVHFGRLGYLSFNELKRGILFTKMKQGSLPLLFIYKKKDVFDWVLFLHEFSPFI